MGDIHFLLQNTLSGLVFLFFAWCGIWIVNDQAASFLKTPFLTHWQSLVLVLFSPFLGSIIQGVWTFFAYVVRRQHPYKDEARSLIGEKIRVALENTKSLSKEVKDNLSSAPDDSLFVWYYYSGATEQLIEWARRRRDFQHIGENWSTATLSGFLIGLIIGAILYFDFAYSGVFLKSLFFVIAVFWMLGLITMRRMMKKDADAMEMVWALAQIYPELQEKLRCEPHTKINP